MLSKVKALFVAAMVAITGLFAGVVTAAPPDFTTLTDAVDYSTVQSSLLTVAGALAVVFILWAGASMILGALKKR